MRRAWRRDRLGTRFLGAWGVVCAARVAVLATAAVAAPAVWAGPADGHVRRAPRLVRPALGDWEGTGPHGLRMSFSLVQVGRSVRVADLAVSLPSSCRAPGEPGYFTTNFKPRYYPPTRAPEPLPAGAFVIKPAGAFAIVGVNSDVPKFPLVVIGRFRSRRAGSAVAPAYHFTCPSRGWPRRLHFALHAARRPRVSDGSYSGSITGPEAGITGTVHATVVGGGRVLTDLAISWTCPDGGGSFELGPSATTGEFIASDGTVDAHLTPDGGSWSARFGVGGTLSGAFTNRGTGDCTQGNSTAFAAMFIAG